MAASRLMERRGEMDDGIERELMVNPRINNLFTAILRGEIRMTLAGLNWPAGGSRFVVGRAV
jgi:hypothetical protein